MPDPRYATIRVDSHFFDDHIDVVERQAADQLIELAEHLVISIAVPHSVRRELDHPNTPAATRMRAARLPYTINTGMGDANHLEIIRSIMRGNALPGKHSKDAAHLFDAGVWQSSYFVTCDERILRKQAEIGETIHGLRIVKPSELLAIYESYPADQ